MGRFFRGLLQWIMAYIGHAIATIGFFWIIFFGLLGGSWWALVGVPFIALGIWLENRADI